ncbi:hypothetical protein BH23GEM1_BH23GEM1_00550 [soil metagenome]
MTKLAHKQRSSAKKPKWPTKAAQKPAAELATKLAARKPRLIPQPNGRGALLSGGVPGHRGGTGRPPSAFTELCRQMASGERTVNQIERILQSHSDPQFMAALRWASEHGYGKPAQAVELSGPDGAPVEAQVWRFGSRKITF